MPEDPPARITRRELEAQLHRVENDLRHMSQAIPTMAATIAYLRERLAIPAQTEMDLDTPTPEEVEDES